MCYITPYRCSLQRPMCDGRRQYRIILPRTQRGNMVFRRMRWVIGGEYNILGEKNLTRGYIRSFFFLIYIRPRGASQQPPLSPRVFQKSYIARNGRVYFMHFIIYMHGRDAIGVSKFKCLF